MSINIKTKDGKNIIAGNVDTSYLDRLTNKIDDTREMISDEWNASRTYAINDFCIYDNKLYICTIQNTGIIPTDTNYWQRRYLSTTDFILTEDKKHGAKIESNGNFTVYKNQALAWSSDDQLGFNASLSSWKNVTSQAISITASCTGNNISVYSNGFECRIAGEIYLANPITTNGGWISEIPGVTITNAYRPYAIDAMLVGFDSENNHSPVVWNIIGASGKIAGFIGRTGTISRIVLNGRWSILKPVIA